MMMDLQRVVVPVGRLSATVVVGALLLQLLWRWEISYVAGEVVVVPVVWKLGDALVLFGEGHTVELEEGEVVYTVFHTEPMLADQV